MTAGSFNMLLDSLALVRAARLKILSERRPGLFKGASNESRRRSALGLSSIFLEAFNSRWADRFAREARTAASYRLGSHTDAERELSTGE